MENEITVKLKVSGSINIPDHILDKIADSFKWIEEVIHKPECEIVNLFEESSFAYPTKSAREHALAAKARQSNRKYGKIIERIAKGLDVSSVDIICDVPNDFGPTAQDYADAARQRQSERDQGPTPGPAFDFASLIGLCEKSTDDVVDQGRLNADRIGLAIAGISAFGLGKSPTDEDIAKYRDAVRRYIQTLGQIADKTRKIH